MATSTTTQNAASLAANSGSLPRKPQNNAGLQKPKLTGWAQAAARSLPKSQQHQHQQQQRHQQSQRQQQQSQHSPTKSNANSLTNNNSSSSLRKSRKQTNGNNTSNTSNNANSNRPRQPYNRDEVRNYMRDLFTKYTSSTSISTYNGLSNSRRGNNLDWGAVTNNRYRNKKYGSLNEIAQVLRNWIIWYTHVYIDIYIIVKKKKK